MSDLDLNSGVNLDRYSELLNDRYTDVSSAIAGVKVERKSTKMAVMVVSAIYDMGFSELIKAVAGNGSAINEIASILSPLITDKALSSSNRKSEKYSKSGYVNQVGAMRNEI